MSIVTRPALRYHGAKFRLASWLLRYFPKHVCYVEPFGGAAGVLLQKPRSYVEVYNDLDGDVVNFFRVLRDPVQRELLLQQLVLTPYARDEFELAWALAEDPIERARRLCVRAQMGFGSSGATKGCTGFRIDTKRAYSTAQHLWMEYPDALTAVGLRFSGVLIENRPAIEVMPAHDALDTLHFVDPPYVLGTRKLDSSGRGCYRHEMSNEDHEDLLKKLNELRGMVVVTGYESELYNDLLSGWKIEKTSARISAWRGTALRTEVLWMNQACADALEIAQADLFQSA
jgi:DNA adenine methylase